MTGVLHYTWVFPMGPGEQELRSSCLYGVRFTQRVRILISYRARCYLECCLVRVFLFYQSFYFKDLENCLKKTIREQICKFESIQRTALRCCKNTVDFKIVLGEKNKLPAPLPFASGETG